MDPEIYTVCLPDIGEGVVEGEVIEWLKNVGDNLKQDEPVVVVMTDKATVELPAPYPGILVRQYYRVGEISIKDKPLYDIRVSTISKEDKKKVPKVKEEVSSESKVAASGLQEIQKPSEMAHPIGIHSQRPAESNALATPKVRGLAKELGIDIDLLKGTGKDGRVTEDDLKGYVDNHSMRALPPSSILQLDNDELQPLAGIRGLMARRMAEAHEQIPQFSYFEQVEATHLIQLRQKYKIKAAEQGIQLSYMPFFIRALSLTIQQFPLINSSVDMANAQIVLHKHHNVGIAMASPYGLVVPVLKDVQSMHLEDVIKAYEALKAKALQGKLSPSDMKEATITITNFGAFDGSGTWATPMINFPEVAILGTARIRKEPVIRNDEVVIRDMLPASWSFDHRLIDGELAISISHHFSKLIRDPAPLI